MGPLAIILFFLGLLIVILIHEAGHYLAARGFGFKVEEYFVGFGPRLWSFRRGEIEYGVKALPLGGYVKIAGMNPYEPVAPQDAHRAYGAKPRWQRGLVIFAGPGSHFLVGALLFAVALMAFGDYSTSKVVIGSVQQTVQPVAATPAQEEQKVPSPASLAGLRPGDVLIQVEGVSYPTLEQLRVVMTRAARANAGGGDPVTMVVKRGDSNLTVVVTPVLADVPVSRTKTEERGLLGFIPGPERVGPVTAVVRGGELVVAAVGETVGQVAHIFGPEGLTRVWHLLTSDDQRQVTDPTSVVGIGQQIGSAGSQGNWAMVLMALAFLTVFVGLINLIPLPPFDGGHLLVLLIEKIRGRDVDMRKLIPVSVAVMTFLGLFVMANVFLDVTKPLPLP